ncbi:MAG: regulatory protein RecX [Actinomycetales bacterium]|nr:regulatory protein RecX [Actinomycetales bacterium]
MASQHAGGGADGPSAARAAAHLPAPSGTRARLAARTQEILDRPRAAPDPEQAEREKAVVRECRYLMRLLSTRRRTEGEMRDRLTQREVPAAIAHEVMGRIDRAGLIDDAAFAHEWVQQRRELRSLGDEALRRELEKKSVEATIIASALASGDGEDDEEEQRCRDLVRSRIRNRDRQQLRVERDGAHRRRLSRRLDALLTRKGYPGDLAVRVISAELRNAARESAD